MLGIFFCREYNFKPKNYAEIWYPGKEGWYAYMIRNLSMRIIAEHNDVKSRKWHPRTVTPERQHTCCFHSSKEQGEKEISVGDGATVHDSV
jgi:hypothetical protein